jgi:hypothetical protein
VKIRRIWAILAPIILSVLIVATPVFAAAYSGKYTVIESDGTDYDMLPVMSEANITWLAANGFMSATGLDTRIETLGGLDKPHMVVDDMILTAIPIAADSQTNLYFSTGNTALSNTDIITGYDGYFTTTDAAGLEPGGVFEID